VPTETSDALRRSRRRLEELVDSLSCSACGSEDWFVRRSILGDKLCQDDVMVKCADCFAVRWHGIPLTADEWDEELEARDGRNSIDGIGQGDGGVLENLVAMGYVASKITPPHGENAHYGHGVGSTRRPR